MSLSDRELLELAAKANWAEDLDDMSIRWGDMDECILYLHADNQDHNGIDREYRWHPLDENHDAFSLAIRLGIVIDPSDIKKARSAYVSYPLGGSHHLLTNMEVDDEEHAMRRLIVRAAAEIGKAIQEKH